MTNYEIRLWYHEQLLALKQADEALAQAGASLETRARQAHAARHQARLDARTKMHPADAELLAERDRDKYGHPDGPTFDLLLAAHQTAGLPPEEAYLQILESSTRTDVAINRRLGLP